jgi:hypothetical protein
VRRVTALMSHAMSRMRIRLRGGRPMRAVSLRLGRLVLVGAVIMALRQRGRGGEHEARGGRREEHSHFSLAPKSSINSAAFRRCSLAFPETIACSMQ